MLGTIARRPVRSFVTVFAAVGLMACGSEDGDVGLGPGGDGDGDGDVGSFSATIDGDLNATIEGFAFHGQTTIDPETGDQGWAAVMGNGDDETEAANLVALVHLGARPSTGTYALENVTESDGVDTGEWGALAAVGLGTQSVVFSGGSVSGTVTVTSSSPDRVEGTFDFQASGFDLTRNPPVERTVTISGTFEAVSDNAFTIPVF